MGRKPQEVYLWHGTNVRRALSIAQNDFRIDLAAGSSEGPQLSWRGREWDMLCSDSDPAKFWQEVFSF